MTWVALTAWAVFAVWYTVRAKWWKVAVGRNTFFTSLAVVALLLPERNLLTYLFVTSLAIHRIYIMERAQRENRHYWKRPVA